MTEPGIIVPDPEAGSATGQQYSVYLVGIRDNGQAFGNLGVVGVFTDPAVALSARDYVATRDMTDSVRDVIVQEVLVDKIGMLGNNGFSYLDPQPELSVPVPPAARRSL